MAEPYNPKHPTRPVPLARMAECMAFAILRHPLGYWSYLGRFADNPTFKLPDHWAWIDIPDALEDAAHLVADLAKLAAFLPGGEREVRRMIHGRIEELEAAAEAARQTAERRHG
ncbi:hypothetical protein [Methylobacterium nodulans]|uniref:Uncharacterized protein n=1 Tax=Methylobacterium nodulans (strain LMG 21967 / CNCM I-2342 / ORS 2060) TaxID=460265 RepID=B8INV8_METNO|nr:hypothetical protein [Methylobacterium nodulans]ACL58474.1 hypothetical protein Mnod_3564 [Methylobacterium nodulans ORS 2060]